MVKASDRKWKRHGVGETNDSGSVGLDGDRTLQQTFSISACILVWFRLRFLDAFVHLPHVCLFVWDRHALQHGILHGVGAGLLIPQTVSLCVFAHFLPLCMLASSVHGHTSLILLLLTPHALSLSSLRLPPKYYATACLCLPATFTFPATLHHLPLLPTGGALCLGLVSACCMLLPAAYACHTCFLHFWQLHAGHGALLLPCSSRERALENS